MAYILGFFFGLGVEVLPDAAVAATYREIECKKTRKSSFLLENKSKLSTMYKCRH